MNKTKKKRENKTPNETKTTEPDPKEQRDRKPRPVVPPNNDKVPDSESVQVDFTNLKKETDEIKKLTESSKYSKRGVSSNWERYEKKEDEDEFTTAADFSSLLQAPVSGGGHFQFKSEKDWDVKIKSNYSEYFSLNLKTINDGILSIPFYERHGIDSALLNPSQVIHMNNDAVRFQNKLKVCEKKKGKQSQNLNQNKLVNDDQISVESFVNDTNIPEDPDEVTEKLNQRIINIVDDLETKNEISISSIDNDNLSFEEHDAFEKSLMKNEPNSPTDVTVPDSHLLEEEVPIIKKPTIVPKTVDLEQWLDDILDD